jgi:prepilin-type N-terminal cleavage/methylation domain-containing protein
MRSAGKHPAIAHRGMTLIELLIVIVIISVLLGITVVVLPMARRSASETKSLANLRAIHSVFMHSAEARRGAFPFYNVGEPVTWDFPGDPNPHVFSFGPVWMCSRMWPVLVQDVASWEDEYRTWVSPGVDPESFRASIPGLVSYWYSNSFLAAPSVWSPEGPVTEADITPQRVVGVRHPSAKVLLYDAFRAYLGTEASRSARRPLVFVDGAADLRFDHDALETHRNRLKQAVYAPEGPPSIYHDTLRGIHGRDF